MTAVEKNHADDVTRRGRRPTPARPPSEVSALRAVERTYRDAEAVASSAREARNAAVRAALLDGWTHQQIGEATGLTRGRIGQLATKETA